MKKRIMIMAICAVIAIGLATPLSAQNVYGDAGAGGAGTLQSNTNVATAGIFASDVDNYVNYHKYSTVLKDSNKWFSFLTGRTAYGGALDAGYARYFGGIYVGAWFRGNVVRSDNVTHKTKTIAPLWDDANEILLQTTERTSYTAAYNETTNNFEFLIGAAGHGIKVGFFESTSSNKNGGSPNRNVIVVDDIGSGIKEYTNAVDSYTRNRSYLRPYLGWGSTFPVAGMGVRPYVDIGFGIYSDEQIDKYSNYIEVNGVKQNVVSTIGAGYENGYLQPYGKFGAWLDLAKKESVQQSIRLEYAINLRMYDNSASGLGGVGGTVTWNQGYVNRVTEYTDSSETETDMTYTVTERSNISHTITPGYKVTGEPYENLKVGFSAALPITFGSVSSDEYTKRIQKYAISYKDGRAGYVTDTNTLTYTTNGHNETSTFGVDLNLAVGASYQLIPNRFGINAGVSASPVRYLQTVERRIPRTTASITTTVTTQDDGSVTQNDKDVQTKTENDRVRERSVWQQYTGTLSGGFTFNFNEHAALDLAVYSYAPNTFRLDIADINVIFTVKY